MLKYPQDPRTLICGGGCCIVLALHCSKTIKRSNTVTGVVAFPNKMCPQCLTGSAGVKPTVVVYNPGEAGNEKSTSDILRSFGDSIKTYIFCSNPLTVNES